MMSFSALVLLPPASKPLLRLWLLWRNVKSTQTEKKKRQRVLPESSGPQFTRPKNRNHVDSSACEAEKDCFDSVNYRYSEDQSCGLTALLEDSAGQDAAANIDLPAEHRSDAHAGLETPSGLRHSADCRYENVEFQ